MSESKTQSYVLPCTTAFRDAVAAQARARGATPTDLARAALLLLDPGEVERFPDPGEPAEDERETVLVRSGSHAGRTVLRKPRLQLRLPVGLPHATIRKALGLALAVGRREQRLDLRGARDPSAAAVRARAEADVAELRDLVQVALPHLPDGVRSEADARYMLGLPPNGVLDPAGIKARFKRLAQLLHPDRPLGDKTRMALLLDARRLLERAGKG